ncbi:hypothetical protein L1049_024931 [Liquidambar formosana]|uniref:Bifunctional inhibitor/plant lipid transfer protein/seed storage helical domain-containing protein n=1 Tax=Liquidambar formosana TaxID=63359 RepID=A0AAP0RW01_LIQFO
MKAFVACLFLLLVAAAALWAPEPTRGARAGPGVQPDVFKCSRVAALLGECFTYLSGMDSKPLPSCCDGAKMIINMASKPEEKTIGCRCYKEATSYFHNIKDSAMADLSKACQVELPIFTGKDCNG